jgi:hypothetical protein
VALNRGLWPKILIIGNKNEFKDSRVNPMENYNRGLYASIMLNNSWASFGVSENVRGQNLPTVNENDKLNLSTTYYCASLRKTVAFRLLIRDLNFYSPYV